ncbi:uncharacterized protein SPPG_00895 [Spizellomyces punctatus DAOM BR117]|uniref:Uncharacterized protein n=1 Tax=Spizellomyces punctatus (strain DAOM BR117) TaxID=645134 RepID=A0A0L0HRA1_SPIPD|nr:uncharacterized protein SPPG_00895 [Spizellomyces punctatus DAOM BR117]KND03409.1 hypothetical protein SPPG_00895 [Spizellomyces punctatus DAOM BR117]|eukprot:XP_016611448.1 hypothetical protein SPPG_00895 [Spizellomyces punctatus DAOM BR117]
MSLKRVGISAPSLPVCPELDPVENLRRSLEASTFSLASTLTPGVALAASVSAKGSLAFGLPNVGKAGSESVGGSHFGSRAMTSEISLENDDNENLQDTEQSGPVEVPAEKLSYKERLRLIPSRIPGRPAPKLRKSRSTNPAQSIDRLRHTEAIIALLERKRNEYREQRRQEIMEHAARSKIRMERLLARKKDEDIAQERQKLPTRLPTSPQTYRNLVPSTWTSAAWYREIVQQMHRSHPHHLRRLPADSEQTSLANRIPSREVLFGRLLTPGAMAFRDHKTVQTPLMPITPKVSKPVPKRPSTLKKKKRTSKKRRSQFNFGAKPTGQAQLIAPFLPIPPMPSLTRPIKLSESSEQVWHEDDVKLTHDSKYQHNLYRFTRMADSLIRNKEVSNRLLSADSEQDEEVDDSSVLDPEIMCADDNRSDIAAYDLDREYDIIVRRGLKTADTDNIQKDVQEEGSSGMEREHIQGITRAIVSASRRGMVAVEDFIGKDRHSGDRGSIRAKEVDAMNVSNNSPGMRLDSGDRKSLGKLNVFEQERPVTAIIDEPRPEVHEQDAPSESENRSEEASMHSLSDSDSQPSDDEFKEDRSESASTASTPAPSTPSIYSTSMESQGITSTRTTTPMLSARSASLTSSTPSNKAKRQLTPLTLDSLIETQHLKLVQPLLVPQSLWRVPT